MTPNSPSPRAYNFSAGPAMLPEPVIRQIQAECLDWKSMHRSVMELSHRSAPFLELMHETERLCREILNIPVNYHVFFITSSARSQFSMVPMNLLQQPQDTADYLVTGLWSQLAVDDARKFANVNIVADGQEQNYTTIPPISTWTPSNNAHYFFYCPNETVHGVEFTYIPEVGDVPLVADMTSYLFSSTIDVNRFGVIFAGTQKNIGVAGLTLAIVREDLVTKPLPGTPPLYDYSIYRDYESLLSTPNTFAIYVMNLVLKWVIGEGGLTVIGERNRRKAKMIYDEIDQSDFYKNPVDKPYRSQMNVPFKLPNLELENAFLEEATAHPLLALEGHRHVGGLRASIYNAMPEAGVKTLVDFMKRFREKHSG